MTDDEFTYQLNKEKKYYNLRRQFWQDETDEEFPIMYALLWLQLLGLAETAVFKRKYR
ncbi:hypothetical protein LCGC14_1062210 [marine sediment metagenome]|uniref:Uncharacterized protein n=1 Tax=marine sediment metagenome TaxID=412755 RepID=A0A0F9Q3R3_9ZZZZ